MPDHSKLKKTAERLIEANGREISLVIYDTTEQDDTQPWLGATDPRSASATTESITGVFVEPESAVRLGILSRQGDLYPRIEKIIILAPNELDLTNVQEVIDESDRWTVLQVHVLKPGIVEILNFIAVKR